MKLLIGLGNPGTKYLKNRHNAGHLFIDSMANNPNNTNIQFFKTNTFMNDSGVFVKKQLTANRYPLTALYIAHDDLDIPLGSYKIQMGVGPKVHYGVASVENELGTKDFWRIRIGVDNRDPQNRTPGEEYVLQDFTGEELIILGKVYEEIRNDLSQLN